ncbi:hypothetical protein GGTG_12274 [Gaeumannomyces tritici R3-111a-1]|uniref:tRNA dimethylallyltransferase n=1 Tax=Gaeumannomyces tritici (strain R3-111a-1) TaxID=644352 RepID=J3PFJ9_GAET3|nr:hypothetical protein GGTG_12274 [Gaeumannomyces tritici R3-111a-1]EJT70101.1 hypothetical protein GGTG_12274 [Gaeumannomyces tritici R3-111a-1]
MLLRALPVRCLSPLRQIPTFSLVRRRYDSSMAAQNTPPPEPLVMVLGTTGTGKSDLAVELACRFNGEVINADAMQMYKGLPIITNKISAEEQRGIPHHLLDTIGLDEPTWTVHEFRHEADRVIREIRSRGRLPIVVGGTHYYADGLLFDDRLVTRADEAKANVGGDQEQQSDPQLSDEEPSLQDAPTETLLARLREVDPVIAERWHPNDRRKIWRSLQIYLTTGRRASDIYAEQQRRRDEAKQQQQQAGSTGDAAAAAAAPWNTLLFWVYSRRDVLNARLDRRVDAMLERGLVDETRELHDYYLDRVAAGGHVDRTSGIWQSIGFAQMEPYLDALRRQQQQQGGDDDETTSPARLDALKRSGVEAVKGATRRYAKHQNRWITYKTLPLLQGEGALGHLFLVDSTDAGTGTAWAAEVADKARAVAERYLAGDALPAPESLSNTAADVLHASLEAVNGRRVTWGARTCDVCRATLVTEELWQTHISGNRHKRAVKAAQRRALAIRENRPTTLAVVEGDVLVDEMSSSNQSQI